ncbi:LigA [Bifidobacterium longum subsp. infantis ATCC 15697 = JCM 1222 = DSM 20088]|uniref:LigA n=1 Tax=Bifidobacterium longum subsp. infantis (strain ATCC 15697 / DSM 20088 / JCM 1222 / NCTC 11817 / S12) TaxID=391904 RepID=B7GR42_BIFLS|nr:LigA [Bifidobacterium longum subsp. infantis ATCC 15697 = JCM 1222 = DSM 20088]
MVVGRIGPQLVGQPRGRPARMAPRPGEGARMAGTACPRHRGGARAHPLAQDLRDKPTPRARPETARRPAVHAVDDARRHAPHRPGVPHQRERARRMGTEKRGLHGRPPARPPRDRPGAAPAGPHARRNRGHRAGAVARATPVRPAQPDLHGARRPRPARRVADRGGGVVPVRPDLRRSAHGAGRPRSGAHRRGPARMRGTDRVHRTVIGSEVPPVGQDPRPSGLPEHACPVAVGRPRRREHGDPGTVGRLVRGTLPPACGRCGVRHGRRFHDGRVDALTRHPRPPGRVDGT